MRGIPYASAVGSLMYATLCTKSDIYFVVDMVNIYQSEPGEEHWIAVKYILKYLRRTRDYMLVYQDESLEPIGYTDSDFQSDRFQEVNLRICVHLWRWSHQLECEAIKDHILHHGG